MARGRYFRVLVFPVVQRFGDACSRIRFRVYCEWQRERGAATATLLDSVLLAPDLPFSFIPTSWPGTARRRVALSVMPDAPAHAATGSAWGLGPCVYRVATFTLRDLRCRPCPSLARRTFSVSFMHGDGMPPGDVSGSSPFLGADFLAEHRARLVVDYGLLEQRASDLGLDPLAPCGYLRLPR